MLSIKRKFLANIILAVFFVQVVHSQPALAETRSLWLHITQTKETDRVVYKRDGRYLKSGLKRLNHLLRDFRRDESVKMDPELLDLLWQVYRKSGSKQPIHVISGYRSPKTNNLLRKQGKKVARHSQHLNGKAIDFYLPDVPAKRLQVLGLREHKGGVGYYKGSFVHLDTGSVRHWPPLSSRQLTKVFPQGRTIHLPKNKKRLKGYEVANANLRKGLFYDGRDDIDNNPQSLISRLLGLDNTAPIDDDIELALAEGIPRQVADNSVFSPSLASLKTVPVPTPRPLYNPDNPNTKLLIAETQIDELLAKTEINTAETSNITGYVPIPTSQNSVQNSVSRPEKKENNKTENEETIKTHELKTIIIPRQKPKAKKPQLAFYNLINNNKTEKITIKLTMPNFKNNKTKQNIKQWAISKTTRVGNLAKLTKPNFKNNIATKIPTTIIAQKFGENNKLRADKFSGKALTTIALIAYNKEKDT